MCFVGPQFCGGILNFWPYLLELHEKTSRTILNFQNLTLNIGILFAYKLVVTLKGFLSTSLLCASIHHFVVLGGNPC